MSKIANLVSLCPSVTPTAFMCALTDRLECDWRIKAVFAPDLGYEQALKNLDSDHLAENDTTLNGPGHPLIDSVFAWNRSNLRLSQLGFATEMLRRCDDTVEATTVAEFDINFKAYFSDVKTLEAFEVGYLAGNILRDITQVDITSEESCAPAIFNMTWSDLDDIEWSLKDNNFMALSFRTTVTGTFRSELTPGTFCLPTELLTIKFSNHVE